MKDKKEIIKYKFILLGDSQVGKSSIFHKLSKNEFLEANLSTQGQDHMVINFNDLKIDINGKKEKKNFNITLFDTAGQERYRSVTTNFIKHADGILLIYDITSKITFEHIDAWLDSIQENLSDWEKSDYLIMMLGNKLDLVKEDEKERKVDIEEVKNKFEDKGIILGGEISAKEFTKSQLEDMFKEFTIKLFNKIGKNNVNNQQLEIRPKKKNKNCC